MHRALLLLVMGGLGAISAIPLDASRTRFTPAIESLRLPHEVPTTPVARHTGPLELTQVQFPGLPKFGLPSRDGSSGRGGGRKSPSPGHTTKVAKHRHQTFRIPTVKVPTIKHPVPTVRFPTVKVPTIKHPVPTVRFPTVKVPTIKHPVPTVRFPTVKVPTIKYPVPTVRFPTVKVPTIKYPVPTVRIPTVKVPTIKYPVPTVRFPTVKVPTVKVPTLRIPTVKVPTVRYPTHKVPTLKIPTVKYPTVKVATLRIPTIKYPTVKVPTLKVPTVKIPTVKYPTIKVATLKIPTIKYPTFKVPTVKIPTVKYPTIKVATLKIPTIKYPTFKVPTVKYPTFKYPTIKYPTIKCPVIIPPPGWVCPPVHCWLPGCHPTPVEEEPAILLKEGEQVTIGGRRLGAAPGQVQLKVGPVTLVPELLDWQDDQFTMVVPYLELTEPIAARMLVILADESVMFSNVTLVPGQPPQPPAPALPELNDGETTSLGADELGKEPGNVQLKLPELTLPVEIVDWEAEYCTVKLPYMALTEPKEFDVIIRRSDGTVALETKVLVVPTDPEDLEAPEEPEVPEAPDEPLPTADQ